MSHCPNCPTVFAIYIHVFLMIVFEDWHVLTEPFLDWLSRDDDFTKSNFCNSLILKQTSKLSFANSSPRLSRKEFFDQYARARARQDVFCSCGHMTIVFWPVRACAREPRLMILLSSNLRRSFILMNGGGKQFKYSHNTNG